MSRKSPKSRSQSDPTPEEPRDDNVENLDPAKGTAETATETVEEPGAEEAADVQLTIKGTDRAARAAAKRFGEGAAPKPPPVATPANDPEEPEDPTAVLLSDGKNMVIVTRQKPRVIKGPDGDDVATNSRIPGRYSCPTSKGEIEELVFDQHGGSKYKCTIHPDTTDGENKILGHFTIEHPDPKCPPFISGVTIDIENQEEEHHDIPTRAGSVLGSETDPLAAMRDALSRRLARAQMKKEIEELESQVQDLEGKKQAPVIAPSSESEELRKLREENAKLQASLAEKKVNDRFDKLEDSITKLAASVTALATAPAKKSDEGVLFSKMLEQSQQHSKDMIALMQAQTAAKQPVSSGDDLDKFLSRAEKLKAITGGGEGKSGRLSEVENRLIDIAWDQLSGSKGGDVDPDGDPYEDALKIAIKEFAPIAKTFVEKKMNQETAANGGAPLSPEAVQRIQLEAGAAAAKKIQEDLLAQGLKLVADEGGKLYALPAPKSGTKPVVPPRQPGSRVVSETRTSGGVVKKVAIEPADLSKKTTPPGNAATAEAPKPTPPPKGEEAVPKRGIFPKLGPDGSTLHIDFPVRPGELKYDRKYAVNFVLDGIRSEIRQDLPKRAETDQRVESYVVGDAMQYLDDEMLDRILAIDSGAQLEALLAPWGDAAKIAEIKEAGQNETVASYLRKLVLSIQREWQGEKETPPQS